MTNANIAHKVLQTIFQDGVDIDVLGVKEIVEDELKLNEDFEMTDYENIADIINNAVLMWTL